MTEHTRELISRFSREKSKELIPPIILALQEEDDVSNTIRFKNCFRLLRNLAGHEPATITAQITNNLNLNKGKICFVPEDDQINNRVVVDLVQFTAWMFNMYQIRHNDFAYIAFWKQFILTVCPNISVDNRQKFDFDMKRYNSDVAMVTALLQFIEKTRHIMPTYSLQDPYLMNLYKDNKKVFWRMMIPDMMIIVQMMVCDVIQCNAASIDSFLYLFSEREGV